MLKKTVAQTLTQIACMNADYFVIRYLHLPQRESIWSKDCVDAKRDLERKVRL